MDIKRKEFTSKKEEEDKHNQSSQNYSKFKSLICCVFTYFRTILSSYYIKVTLTLS